MAAKRIQRLRDLGEAGLINWIRSNMPGNVSGLLRGIGDDAAVLRGGELISTDMLVEGVHFVKKWHDPLLLGRKALSVNLSDLAAMGGDPRCAFLSLALNPGAPVKDVETFLTGFAQVARENGMAVAGGDLCASPGPMVITVTVVGRADRPVLRSGARPGDVIFVSGTLGDAGLALRLITKKGPLPGGRNFKFLRHKLLNPAPQLSLGRRVSQYASAMIDLSDGMAVDINNLCRESGVGAGVELDKLPLSAAYRFQKARIKEKKGLKYYQEALYGGEDYELLFTVPPSLEDTVHALGETVTKIGEVVEAGNGVVLETPNGPKILEPEGKFAHFSK